MNTRKFPFLFVVILFCCVFAVAQTDGEWMRVQTDDGDFSIEVPADHKYFFSEDGYSVSRDSSTFELRNMRMLNAYHKSSMLSLEVYDAGKGGLSAMFEKDKKRSWVEEPKTKVDGVEMRTLKWNEGGAHGELRYFNQGKRIYILFAASRGGRTPEMERFLSSVRLKESAAAGGPGTPFSKLKSADIGVAVVEKADKAAAPPLGARPPADPTVTPFKLLRFPSPSYVDSARMNHVEGNIQVRVHFASDGFVPRIEVLKALPDGLLRQALYSAIRTKYLPQEKEGKPVDVVRTVHVSFNIY